MGLKGIFTGAEETFFSMGGGAVLLESGLSPQGNFTLYE